jgi:hypothetical protein
LLYVLALLGHLSAAVHFLKTAALHYRNMETAKGNKDGIERVFHSQTNIF